MIIDLRRLATLQNIAPASQQNVRSHAWKVDTQESTSRRQIMKRRCSHDSSPCDMPGKEQPASHYECHLQHTRTSSPFSFRLCTCSHPTSPRYTPEPHLSDPSPFRPISASEYIQIRPKQNTIPCFTV